jgi:hypothetical protein
VSKLDDLVAATTGLSSMAQALSTRVDAGYDPVAHFIKLASQARASGNEAQAKDMERMAKESAVEAKRVAEAEKLTRQRSSQPRMGFASGPGKSGFVIKPY